MRPAPRTVLPARGHGIAAALTVLVAVLLTLLTPAATHAAPDGPVPHTAASATDPAARFATRTPRADAARFATRTSRPDAARFATGISRPDSAASATDTSRPDQAVSATGATGTLLPHTTASATDPARFAATGTPRPEPAAAAAHTPGPDSGPHAEAPCATGCAAPATRARHDHGAERPAPPDHHATPAHGTAVPLVGVRTSARPAPQPAVPGPTPYDRGRAPPAPTGT
ncbi:hypothetical protein JCM4814A_49790 [Streptomyces phaeofaciens JCM 4814]|uniref:Secreted protein n=1 Tax=Streptomyces phaeofaciens TaxID=68254 RepID=A0A918LPF7_9ACTN|nr:hypothetical protein [Streptomyces phaeofaciens]GGT32905.1 hypothetical protein GCM10010226_06450 [Streptomyces phaeofaciens]